MDQLIYVYLLKERAVRLIHLVRHGDHDEVGRVLSGRSDIALNIRGEAQAVALAARLAHAPVASVHSSPRPRALQTAAPIAHGLAMPVVEAPALDEIDFGTFTSRSFVALNDDPDWLRWNSARGTVRCPGGETMAQAVARARDYLWSIPIEGAPAVCITHCDIIRGVVADLIGLSFDRIFALDCDPGSITTVALDNGQARLVTLNVPVQPPAPA